MAFKMNRFFPPLKTDYYFFAGLISICVTYLIYELIYIPYWALSADEFVFARHIYEYTYHVPYLDFAPYKTILGYYLLSLPFFFTKHFLAPLFYIKDEIALINTLCLGMAAYWSRKFFNRTALILSLLAIMANQTFLLYGTDLRVDMLTSWACLFAVLSLLHSRMILAGLIMATAFLISQKALWAFVAINSSLLLCWLLFRSTLYSLRHISLFNLTTALPIVAYIIGWSLVSDPTIVLHNLFYEAYIQAGIDWYTPIYLTCWLAVLTHGPMLFFLWPTTLVSIVRECSINENIQRRIFILSFANISLLLFISYKQAFPYNFVFTVPAFFLLYSEFFTWLLSHKTWEFKPSFWSYIACAVYGCGIFLIVYLGGLPAIYYSAIFVPILLTNLVKIDSKLKIDIILGLFVLTGIALPFYHSVKTSENIDGSYQQAMLNLTAELLKDGGSYVGGIPYLYNNDQAIGGMQNLIGPALEYLYQPTSKLEKLLLPSLYLGPISNQEILNDFDRKAVKIILDNYRIKYLPPVLLNYINHNYQQFNGSVYLYAPLIEPTQLSFTLKFSGQYRIEGHGNSIQLDGKKVKMNTLLSLNQGDHITNAKQVYRLVLVPAIANSYQQFKNDEWVMMIKAIIS